MGLQFTMVDQPDQTIPEDTIVRATLTEIKQHDFEWTDYKQNPPVQKQSSVLQWWWEVKSPDQYTGRRVKGECDTTLGNNTRNRFNQWATALLDREIPVGMSIDVDDLVGLSADISIRHDRDKKDPNKRYERVDEVMPISGGSSDWNSAPPF